MQVSVLRWKPDVKNTRKGYADFRLGEVDLIIKDCAVHKFGPEREGKVWVAFPARQYKDEAGQTKFWNFLQFGKDKNEEFQQSALSALRAHIGGNASGLTGNQSNGTGRDKPLHVDDGVMAHRRGPAPTKAAPKDTTRVYPDLNDDLPF